jgi:hypothetical protein
MGRKRAIDVDELLFHDELPEEEEREEDYLFDNEDLEPESEEDELLPELEIGKNGHIQPRRKRGREEEESPITIDWDE